MNVDRKEPPPPAMRRRAAAALLTRIDELTVNPSAAPSAPCRVAGGVTPLTMCGRGRCGVVRPVPRATAPAGPDGPPRLSPAWPARTFACNPSACCGRFFLLTPPAELADLFGLAGLVGVSPHYNIAPTQPVLAVGLDKAGLGRGNLPMGLVARWASDAKLAPINARSETAAVKPTFAEPFRKRRCLIPASGFYEWMRQGKAKQPYCFRLTDDRPFAFAGLWEAWRPDSGPPLLTCAILTTAANELVRPVHDRMPVILDPRHYDLWIDRAVRSRRSWPTLLRPFPAERMRAYPVIDMGERPRHDDARCLEPAA